MKNRSKLRLLCASGFLAIGCNAQTPPPAVLSAQDAPPSSPIGATPPLTEPVSPLDLPAGALNMQKPDLATLFYAIGQAYRINIVPEQGLTGSGLLRFQGGTLRQLLDSLVEPNDLYMEERAGALYIRKTKIELYLIDYPKAQRSASSTTSVNLAPSSSGSSNSSNGNQSLVTGGSNQQGGNGSGSTGTNGDNTSLQVSSTNDDSFWADIEKDIKATMQKGETINLNRFSGIATIEAPVRRHAFYQRYLKLLNSRINAQVLIEVRFLQIDYDKSEKEGIDLTQLQTALGGVSLGAIKTTTNLTSIGSRTLPGDTLLGNFAAGKLSAVITALEQQGTVHTLVKPSVRCLHNQTSFVKVGDDQTFWSNTANTTVSQNSGLTGQIITQDTYAEKRQTFGIVLPVTASISSDGHITIVMEPARTQLRDISISPNGKSSAANTTDQRINTVLRLNSGESTIIGGLSNDTDATTKRGVPYLGSIPYLGALFRTTGTSHVKSEILMAVTAQIIAP